MSSRSFVFPVRYVSEGMAVQSTSRQLSALGIDVRSLSPPRVGSRVSMALYLPHTSVPEVAIGRVSRAVSGVPVEAGFWADFIVVDPQARLRISNLLSERDESGSANHPGVPRHARKLGGRLPPPPNFLLEHPRNIHPGGAFLPTHESPPPHQPGRRLHPDR